MKKITLITMAILCSVAFTDCAAKKPIQKQQEPQPQPVVQQKTAEELELEKMELELKKIEMQNKIDQAKSESEIQKLKNSNAVKAIRAREGQSINIPCLEESYDKQGEYMAGLGIAEKEDEKGAAKINANRYAVADITSRYIGMIKNGVSQYAKNVNTRSGNKIKENELEGAAEAIGTKLIDKYAENVCTDYEKDDWGTYTCFVAVHVPLKEVVDATIDELGIIQTDIDRAQFRKYMQAELEKQAAAAQAEKRAVEEQRKELGL